MRRLHDNFPAVCRLYAGIDATVSWYNSIHDPYSSLFRVARTPDGAILLWIMALTGAAIILDVIINDWTPNRICMGRFCINLAWKRAFHNRHWLFVILAFCYAAQPYVADRGGYKVALLSFFYSNALQNLVIGLLDAKLRSRSQGWQRVTS